MKVHWTNEGYEDPCSIQQRTVLHPSYLSWRIDPRKLTFQQANDSPDQAFLSSHFKDVDTDQSTDNRASTSQSNLEWDCFCDPRGLLGRGSTEHRWRIIRKTYTAHPSALHFKDKRHRSQVPTLSVLPTNFAPFGCPVRTTTQRCRQDCRSSRRV